MIVISHSIFRVLAIIYFSYMPGRRVWFSKVCVRFSYCLHCICYHNCAKVDRISNQNIPRDMASLWCVKMRHLDSLLIISMGPTHEKSQKCNGIEWALTHPPPGQHQGHHTYSWPDHRGTIDFFFMKKVVPGPWAGDIIARQYLQLFPKILRKWVGSSFAIPPPPKSMLGIAGCTSTVHSGANDDN